MRRSSGAGKRGAAGENETRDKRGGNEGKRSKRKRKKKKKRKRKRADKRKTQWQQNGKRSKRKRKREKNEKTVIGENAEAENGNAGTRNAAGATQAVRCSRRTKMRKWQRGVGKRNVECNNVTTTTVRMWRECRQ